MKASDRQKRLVWAGIHNIKIKLYGVKVTFAISTEIVKVPRPLFKRLRDIAVYAAYIG
ncbi:hypothetical protein [Dendronalium sp. ChiSLP03b]|uniref:hypothetical protein n=1 Tax=Dendronalium sp. ChiSLP03b TaxID=3075381 RepID=UPI002AD32879|nr:hypothetical protein [Dendronalium sp. ChiSLP03b]MDZ8204645.1 hypothetical protein [Dendronalium sp. ChiSLP03b]